MKCPQCLGSGVMLYPIDYEQGLFDEMNCTMCNGDGVVQTNEEWLKSKGTSDLAEWIYNAMFNKSCQNDVADGAYMQMMTKKDYIESWLCEVHKE